MKYDKSLRREKRQNKDKTGMKVDNKNIFLLEGEKVKRGKKANS